MRISTIWLKKYQWEFLMNQNWKWNTQTIDQKDPGTKFNLIANLLVSPCHFCGFFFGYTESQDCAVRQKIGLSNGAQTEHLIRDTSLSMLSGQRIWGCCLQRNRCVGRKRGLEMSGDVGAKLARPQELLLAKIADERLRSAGRFVLKRRRIDNTGIWEKLQG